MEGDMKFSIKHRVTKENIVTVEYEKGENQWFIAINAAIKASANLSYADLSSADLRYANLHYADLSYADLSYADLRYADLRYADLRYADLRCADLDFSSGLSFRCGSFNIKADLRLAAQLAYHFCRIDFGGCDEAKAAQEALKELGNKFHRLEECGKLK